MQNILEVLQDTAIDTLKLLPFLFITYLIMEYIEHKTSNKIRETIKKSGRLNLPDFLFYNSMCKLTATNQSLYILHLYAVSHLLIQ